MTIKEVQNNYYSKNYSGECQLSDDIVKALVDEHKFSKETATMVESIVYDEFFSKRNMYFKKLQEMVVLLKNK